VAHYRRLAPYRASQILVKKTRIHGIAVQGALPGFFIRGSADPDDETEEN
jgi:hypothetical protein